MCCRLRLDTRKLEARGGGLFGANPLTGSIGVVTINLPRLGYQSRSEEEFFQRLDTVLSIARNSLEIKRKILETYTNGGLYPYTKFYLKSIHERFQQYWKNHFSTIGIIGMNEACLNYLGVNLGNAKGKEFALKVMDYMRDKLVQFQEESNSNYNLEATPAEGTSYRLAILDKKFFPDIQTANCDGDTPFYTNSTQLPVNFSDDIFEVLDLQDDLQTKYTGGTVLHIFGGERIEHGLSIRNLVSSICNNYRLPYFTFSPTFSICPQHGYLVGEQEQCPECHRTTEVYSRIVGYLRPVSQWNEGKKAEFKLRTTFDTVKQTEGHPSAKALNTLRNIHPELIFSNVDRRFPEVFPAGLSRSVGRDRFHHQGCIFPLPLLP
jgi:ribonucleoside-triphosphate reductase